MALRDFTDPNGTRWRVWNVSPHVSHWSEGASADGRPTGTEGSGSDEVHRQRRLVPGLEGGWLCFEAEEEKRRLNPVPEEWEELDAPDLARLLEQAAPVSRRAD